MLVYFHRNPKTYQIFYVGVGSRKSRAYDFETGRNPFYRNYLKKYGAPIVQIVHDNLTKEKAHEWEKYYIKLFGRKKIDDGQLVNLSEGGDATPILPEESKQRSIEALRKWVKANPDKNPSFTPEHSERMKLNNPMHRPECVEKIRKINTGKRPSEETRKKQSLLRKGKRPAHFIGYKHSDETKAKLRIINREIANRPEVKEKLSKIKKGSKNIKNSIGVKMINIKTNETIRIFNSITDALIMLGKSTRSGNISSVCNGRRNHTFGYKWEYV